MKNWEAKVKFDDVTFTTIREAENLVEAFDELVERWNIEDALEVSIKEVKRNE